MAIKISLVSQKVHVVFFVVGNKVRFGVIVEAFVRNVHTKVGTGHPLAVAAASVSITGGLETVRKGS